MFFLNFNLKSKSCPPIQFLLMGGWSSATTLRTFWPYLGTDVVRTSLYFLSTAFFCIVPFVQFPLLLSALGRLNAELDPLFSFFAELGFALSRLIVEVD